MRTVANLQLYYAMRSEGVLWYLQKFAKFINHLYFLYIITA